MKPRRWSVLVCAALLASAGPVSAQEQESEASEEGLSTRDAARRTLTTAVEPVPPTFMIWQSEEHDAFIKPVLQIASLLTVYIPHREVERPGEEPEVLPYANRVSTLILTRTGFEGQLFELVTFRSVFERNMGFTLSRNGPVGTSVWEGTASWQARENYIRLSRWGLALTGGILPDPASVDYMSENILDAFGMDPYTRTPLLVGGSNQGQGVLLNYTWEGLTLGFAYTGGNPLTSSLSFGFGGNVTANSTLFDAPLRAFSNGIPGSNIHMNVISPSAMYFSELFDIKAALQFYFVDTDVLSDQDAEITGYNLRGTFQVKLLDDVLRLMGTASYRRNEQLDIQDTSQKLDEDFEGLLFGGGFDVDLGALGFGGNYYWYQSRLTDSDLTNQYINVGLTYWLWEPFVSVGARYARSMAETTSEATTVPFNHTQSFFASLRLLI